MMSGWIWAVRGMTNRGRLAGDGQQRMSWGSFGPWLVPFPSLGASI